MKKFLLCLSFSFVFSTTAYSQFFADFCYDCETSIEVGGVLPQFQGLDNFSPEVGLHIGLYNYRYLDFDKWNLRFGFSYTNLRGKADGFRDPMVFHSFQIPMTLHYRFVDNFQVFAGGELGINLFGKFPVNDGEPFWEYEEDDNIFEFRENITFFEPSLVFGVGYIFKDVVDVNLKYNLGMSDIYKDSDLELKRNWLTLSVAYTFRE